LPTAESDVPADQNYSRNQPKASSGKKHRGRKEAKNFAEPSPSPKAKEVAQHAE
jgi:hypothetical protein